MILSPFFVAAGERFFVPQVSTRELPIVQKTYDLIKWYVPILNRLPRDHKFGLGDRMIAALYDLLEGFVTAANPKIHWRLDSLVGGSRTVIQLHPY